MPEHSQSYEGSLPLDIIIFGGTGDLSLRKLLPALYMAHLHGNLPRQSRIISLGRNFASREDYIQNVDQRSRLYVEAKNLDEGVWREFLERIAYCRLDVQAIEDFTTLAALSAGSVARVFYLATTPKLFATICDNLVSAGMVNADSRVVLEKPLGHDLASAQRINHEVARHFDESQIYRIDHYLGKETVQNLMVLRFGNPILETLWRAPQIKSVQITVAETVSVGTRAEFYDSTGALRDMVQNHLLQLLCIIAMEPPVSLAPDAVRDEKLKVLRSLRPMKLADIARNTVRGQYAAGAVNGETHQAYHDERGVPADSHTETFVALRAHIDSWRWANVPFYLRTGKCMEKRMSQIVIEFTDLPFSIFPDVGPRQANRLVIQLQPEESIQLQIMAKEPGSGMQMRPVNLNLDLQSAFTQRRAEAYERLLIDVMKGRLTHFMRRDELEAAWSWVEPILHGWERLAEPPHPYRAGSWGPPAASSLLARDGLAWFQ